MQELQFNFLQFFNKINAYDAESGIDLRRNENDYDSGLSLNLKS